MSEHLVSLLAAIKTTEEMITTCAGKLQINVFQCKLLGAKVVGMREHLQLQKDFSSSTRRHCDLYFGSLCLVVNRGNKFMQRCCQDEWIKEAVALGNSTAWLSDILLDLDWWCEVVRCTLTECKGIGKSYLQLPRYEGFLELLGKLDIVQCDVCDLVLKLKELGSDQSTREISGYLLHELTRVAEEDADDAVSSFLRSPELSEKELCSGESELGHGTYGIALKSTWFGLPCVKKVMNNPLGKEASILSQLSHPHVIRLFFHWERSDRNRSCLVTELMDSDISAFLKKEGPPTLPVAVDIMLQVAKGMRYLHSMKVVHRDLKSANILVSYCDDSNIQVKLADFGSAKHEVHTSTYCTQGISVGSLYFKAPELFKVEQEEVAMEKSIRYPFKADIYSFAMTCVEILTGEPPFSESESHVPPRLIKSGTRPQLPETCPNFLKSLIAACWEHDPTNRPLNFIEICESLQSFQVFLSRIEATSRLSWSFSLRAPKWIKCRKEKAVSQGQCETRDRRNSETGQQLDISKPIPRPWPDVFDDWRESVKFKLTNVFLNIHLGTLCEVLNYSRFALDHFGAAMDVEPRNFYVVRGHGLALIRDVNPEYPAVAVQDFNLANTVKADDAYILAYRGEAKGMVGDLLGALRDLDKALELEPKLSFIYCKRAYIKEQLGKNYLQETLEDYKKANEVYPPNPSLLGRQGLVRGKLGAFADALHDLDKAHWLEPGNQFVLRQRAEVKFLKGDKVGAESDIEEGRKLSRKRK